MKTIIDFVVAWIPVLIVLFLVAAFILIVEIMTPIDAARAEQRHQDYLSLCEKTGRKLADCELRYVELNMVRDAVVNARSNRDSEDIAAMQFTMMNP